MTTATTGDGADTPADLIIRNADLVVAYDAATGSNAYLSGADVAVSAGRFAFVGRGFTGTAAREVAGRGLMMMPGLVDLHSHPWSESMNRGFGEDMWNPVQRCLETAAKPLSRPVPLLHTITEWYGCGRARSFTCKG